MYINISRILIWSYLCVMPLNMTSVGVLGEYRVVPNTVCGIVFMCCLKMNSVNSRATVSPSEEMVVVTSCGLVRSVIYWCSK